MAENNKNQNMIGEDSLPVTSYWKDVVRRFCKNKIAVIGLIALCIIIILWRRGPIIYQLRSRGRYGLYEYAGCPWQ